MSDISVSINREIKVGDVNTTYTANFEIINNIRICQTESEFQTCKSKKPSFKEIFETWTRFGHFENIQWRVSTDANQSAYRYDGIGGKTLCKYTGGSTPGATSWKYDDVNDLIVQPVNTTDFTGFVSKKSYDDYQFTIRCFSTDSDDDMNGIVAAYAEGSDGMQHTLSFIRTPNNSNSTNDVCKGSYHWYAAIDLNSERAFSPSSNPGPSYGNWKGTKVLANGTLNKSNEPSGGWSNIQNKGGVLVKVKREGNKYIGYTTKFSSTSPNITDLSYELIVDIDSLLANPTYANYYDVLKLFTGKVNIGYCTTSQPNSKYENIEFVDPAIIIYPITKDKSVQNVYKYIDGNWIKTSLNHSDVTVLGYASKTTNDVTGRSWYYNGDSITEIK